MKLKIYKLLILQFLVCNCFAQNSWYLNQSNGADTNSGQSPNNAFQTVEYVTDSNNGFLNPGDTLFIIGTYTNSSFDPDYEFTGNINDPHIWHSENTIRISNLHGAPNQYITIKAFDEATVLKGDGANVFRGTNCSYLRIEGLEVYGQVEGISLETALALQFLYRESNSINTLYRVPLGTTDEEVGNLILPILENITRPSFSDTRGIYLTNVHHIDLINNKIHHTPGNGFRVAECDYINIVQNEVHNCSRKSYSGTHGLVVTKATSIDENDDYKIRILQNEIHHNYNEIYSWAPGKTFITPKIDEGKGISMQRNLADSAWIHGRFLIANNITYWNGYSGVHVNACDRMDFINNTCFMNSYTNTVTYANQEQTGNNIGISAAESDDIRIYNNIAVIDASWGGFPISIRNTSNLEVSDNLVYSINDPIIQDADLQGIASNMIEANPLFIDTDNFNFHLFENSPAIGIANADEAPITDFFGNTRIGNPDLGAIESDFLLDLENPRSQSEYLKVYPNPFYDRLIVEDFVFSKSEVSIFNLSGQKLKYQISIGNDGPNSIVTNQLPKGIYILKIRNAAAFIIKK